MLISGSSGSTDVTCWLGEKALDAVLLSIVAEAIASKCTNEEQIWRNQEYLSLAVLIMFM